MFKMIGIALALAGLASSAHALERHKEFNYNGMALEQFSHKILNKNDLMPGLAVVTGYASDGPRASWVTLTNVSIATTISVWDVPCSDLTSATQLVVDRRANGEANVLFDDNAQLTQLGKYCWVAHGSEAQRMDVLTRLLSVPAEQALPPRDRPYEIVAALSQFHLFMKSGALSSGLPKWNKLSAGQQVRTPEEAASLAGFGEAKVAARVSAQGVGYLLHCGPKTVVGKSGLVVLSRVQNQVNQFSAYIPQAEAPKVLSQKLQEMGRPAKEVKNGRQASYTWSSGSFVTSFVQQDDGSWLFSWTNEACRSGGC